MWEFTNLMGSRPLHNGFRSAIEFDASLNKAGSLLSCQIVDQLDIIVKPSIPNPKITVVLVTFERFQTFLLDAIQSVLMQRLSDVEVIVIDDYSRLSRDELSTARIDDRVGVVRLPFHSGIPSVARNVGVLLARSDVVAFLDDDNLFLDDHLLTLYTQLRKNSEIAGTYCDRHVTCRIGHSLEFHKESFGWHERARLLEGNFIDSSTFAIRRRPLVELGGWNEHKSVRFFEDWELALRIAANRIPLLHINEPLIRYTIHPGNARNHLTRYLTRPILSRQVRNAFSKYVSN